MTIVNPDHLLDQAEGLLAPSAGAPRQADLRRAISTAYYAAFHSVVAALADQFIGVGRRNDPEYALAYRHLDHSQLKRLCIEVSKSPVAAKYRTFVSGGSFGLDLRRFATAFVELQEKRHKADYDPLTSFKTSDVRATLATGRTAIASLQSVGSQERLTFLCLLAFPPR